MTAIPDPALTILVALGGAFVALLAADSSFSIPSLIGLIMLMGVATKNSILMVDYAIIACRESPRCGRPACCARLGPLGCAALCLPKARPIFMTTVAMGAGMVPIAMG